MYLGRKGRQATQPPNRGRPNRAWVQKGMQALFDTRAKQEVIQGTAPGGDTTGTQDRAKGVAATFFASGSQQQVYAHNTSYVLNGAMSIVVYCDIQSLSNYSALVGKQTSTTTNGYELRIGGGASDSQFNFIRANAAGLSIHYLAANAIPSNKFEDLLIVATAPATEQQVGGRNIYINETKIPMEVGYTTANGWPSDAGANLILGRRYDGVTQFDGWMYYVALFNQELTHDDVLRIRSNPWDLFGQRRTQIWVPPGIEEIQRRALILNSWPPEEISNTDVGTGRKPLVYDNGQIKERLAAEGAPLIMDNGTLRTLASGETLLI